MRRSSTSFESGPPGRTVFRPLVGGAPLNVATGLARLGAAVEFVGAIGTDALGQRIWDLLDELGVGTGACVRVDVPTTLAVTSLRDAMPEFTFYTASPAHASPAQGGARPSFAALGPETVEAALVGNASVLYCGSIALMYPASLAAAQAAWAMPGPLRVLDPNVRPRLLRDRSQLRDVIEAFAATADVVKLSTPDAALLFDLDPPAAARHLRAVGARAVVVTLAGDGAYAEVDGGPALRVSAPAVTVRDTTGAGDAAMAALSYGLLTRGWPGSPDAWRDLIGFATAAASLSCEVPGGATAMPTHDAIERLRARVADRTG